MTVSFVGAQGAAATTVTIPAHQVGDLILIFAYRDGSNTVPTAPTAGGTVPTWTQIGSSGGNTNSSRFHHATATATNTTSGTWTNATELICLVYRGATVGASVGGSGAATTTVNYPALSLQRADNTSWVVGVAGHRTATNVELAPGAMVNRASSGTEAAGHDTNATVTTWASTNVTVNASSAYRSWVVELRDKTVVLLADKGTLTETGKDAGLTKGRSLVADKGTFTLSGVAADLRHDVVLSGSVRVFQVAGVPAGVLHNVSFVASAGTFTVTGNDATLTYTPSTGTSLPADTGGFLVAGVNAGVIHNVVVVAGSGSYSVAPVNTVVFKRTYNLVASTRAFNLNFIPASIIYSGGQVAGKSLYYQSILTDPRKSIVNIGVPEHQLVYYVKNFFRIL